MYNAPYKVASNILSSINGRAFNTIEERIKPTDPRIAYFVWGSSEYSFDKSKPYICGVKHYGAGSSRVVRFNRSFGFNYNGIISPFLPSEFTINYFDGFGAVKYGGKWLGVRFVGKGSDIW